MSNNELNNLLKQAIEKMNGDEADGSNGWAKKEAKSVNAPFLGVSVPIKVETPQGSVRCYLALPAEVMGSPEMLLGAIKQLLDMGLPVDLYQPKQNDWNGQNKNQNGNWRSNGGYGGGNGYRSNGYQNGNGNGYRSNGGGW